MGPPPWGECVSPFPLLSLPLTVLGWRGRMGGGAQDTEGFTR